MGGGVLCGWPRARGARQGVSQLVLRAPPCVRPSLVAQVLWYVSPRPLRTVTACHTGVANMPLHFVVCGGCVFFFFFFSFMGWPRDGTGQNGPGRRATPGRARTRKEAWRSVHAPVPRTPCGNDLKASSHSQASFFEPTRGDRQVSSTPHQPIWFVARHPQLQPSQPCLLVTCLVGAGSNMILLDSSQYGHIDLSSYFQI